jgi:hypothetical protein
MSLETYRRPVMYLGRMGYALRNGHGIYLTRGAGSILGLSLATALAVGAGILLIAGAVSLIASGKKSKAQ